MLSIVKDLVTGVVSPVANIFVKKQERKKATELAQAKIAKAKVDGEHEVTMTDAAMMKVSDARSDRSEPQL